MSSGWTDKDTPCGRTAGDTATRLRRNITHPLARLAEEVFLSLFLTTAAHAGLRLSVSPMKIPLVLDAGGKSMGAVSVFNGGRDPVHMTVTVSGWRTTPDGNMTFSPEPVSRSAEAWIRPEFDEFTLPPEGRRIVRINVSLPDTARGSYWGVVFFEGAGADEDQKLGVGARARIGATIYLTARGTEHRDDAVTGMDVVPGKTAGSLVLKAALSNRGNVHYYPAGWFQVMDARGEVLFQEAIPLRVLLPGAETVYTQTWTPTSAGEVRFLATFDLGLETLLQGIKRFSVPDTLLPRPAITMRAVSQRLPEATVIGATR